MIDRLHQLNFGHLFYFWAVARNGSIASACEKLHVTQPTISMQIRRLERSLGGPLFERSGRNLALTELGRTVFEYADDMFSIGREMLGALRGTGEGRTARLYVGVRTVMPKLLTYRLLEPVLHMADPTQIVCREADLDELVTNLARHRFDVVLSDTPIPSEVRVRSFNHVLGESTVAICAVGPLAKVRRRGFPESLDGAPFILPTGETEMRRAVDRWFDSMNMTPRVVAEMDDSALLKEFGRFGAGLFPVPSVVLDDVKQQYSVELVGHLADVKIRYYAITTQRKLTHPAVVLISKIAKEGLLADPSNEALARTA